MEQAKDIWSWPRRVWEVLGAFGGLMALVAAIYGFNAYIDSRVEKIISTTGFLEKVAARVRPSVIFDADERILTDAGGLQYLDRIEVPKNKQGVFPTQIIVTPKHLMPEAPLLTCLDPIWFKITAHRGKAIAWVYELEARGHMGGFEPIRFRLEIAPQ